MNKKYIVYAGEIQSTSDNDIHFIDSKRVMELYNVNPEECIVARSGTGWDRGYDPAFLEKLTILRPQSSGNYTLPEERK